MRRMISFRRNVTPRYGGGRLRQLIKLRDLVWFVVVVVVYRIGFQDGYDHRDPTTCDPPTPSFLFYSVVTLLMWVKDRLF